MPVFYPPTALTQISVAAQQALSYKPLILADFAFSDGITTLHASTDVVTYNSITYVPVLLSAVLSRVQQRTPIGVDVFPNCTITFADPTGTIFGDYELNPASCGFKGAIVTLTLILIDKITGAVSSDSIVKMNGRCDPATSNDKTTVVTAKSKLDLSRTFVPNVPIAKLCPYPFPGTAAQQATVGDWFSIYYPCGYPGGAFTDCNYDIPSCAARGMLPLGRPGWLQYEPPAAWSNPHVYTTGSKATGWNTDNQAKYQSYVPLSYGPALIKGIVANVQGTGNNVSLEVVVGWGDMEANGVDMEPPLGAGGINLVIVNNVVIPHAAHNYDQYFPEPGPKPDSSFYWQYVNNGSRNGNVGARIPGYQGTYTVGEVQYPAADPYGSMMVIVIVVPPTVQSNSNAPPDVLIITTSGKKIRAYNGPSSYNTPDPQYSVSRPIWIIIDMLVTGGSFQYTDFDMGTAVAAQIVCSTLIPYVGVAGPYAVGVQIASDGVSLTITSTTAGGTFQPGPLTPLSVYVGELIQIVPGIWQAGISYSTGNYVSWNGGMYIALGSTTNNQPDVSPSDWGLSPTDDGINCSIAAVTGPYSLTLVSPGVGTTAFIGAGGIDSTAQMLISHERYRLNLILQNRQAVSDLLTGIKVGCNLNLVPNNVTNQLQFFIDQGLGDQQPSPVSGSNDTSAYASYLATGPNSGQGVGGMVNYQYDGRLGVGYVAYNFNDDNIILEGNEPNYTSSLQLNQLPASSTPNRIITPFQNEEILCESDTSTRVDTQDYARMGQSYDATVQMVGVPNFDQLFRQANNYMARLYRGNPRDAATYGDTGGTIIATLKTPGMQIAHLRVGHIVALQSSKYGIGGTGVITSTVSISGTAVTWTSGTQFTGLATGDIVDIVGYGKFTIAMYNSATSLTLASSLGILAGITLIGCTAAGAPPTGQGQLFRIQSIEADNNFNIATITMGWHDDRWFLDSYGNGPGPAFATSATSLSQGPPLGWIDYGGTQPLAGDTVYTSPQYWQPGITIMYNVNADSSISALARSFGRYPVNRAAADTTAPYISLQGTVDTGSGSVPVGPYYIAIVALDAAGNVTFPQLNAQMCQVPLLSTGSLIVPRIVWGVGTASAAFFVGYNPQHMQFQGYMNPSVMSTVNVDVTGLIVTHVTGSNFSSLQVGDLVVVGGVGVSVKTISSSTMLTINTAVTGPQTAVNFTGPLPNSLTISNLTGASNPVVNSFPMPDSRFDHVQIQAKLVRHSGPIGVAISSVATNTLTINNAGFTVNQWQNYKMSVVAYSDAQLPIPVFNATITSNTATVLTLSVDPLANGVLAGSVLIIYSKSTVSTDANGNTVLTDANWVNSLGPQNSQYTISGISATPGHFHSLITCQPADSINFQSGDAVSIIFSDGTLFSETVDTSVYQGLNHFTVSYDSALIAKFVALPNAYVFFEGGLQGNAEVGNLLRFINADGTSYTVPIGANTGTTITTAGPMAAQPVNGAIFIIEEPDWHTIGQSTQSIALNDPLAITDIDVIITNYEDETILVQNLMCSVDGQFSAPNNSPFRMVYVYGMGNINDVITPAYIPH